MTAALKSWAKVHLAAGADVVLLHGPAGPSSEGLPAGTSARPVRHAGNGRASYVPLDLPSQLKGVDLLVLHEGWVLSNYVAAEVAVATRTPYVVMPHGSYEPSMLNQLRRPRNLRVRAEARMLRRAAVVHDFFESEHELALDLAPSARTLAIPTPVSENRTRWSGGGDYFAWFGRYAVHHKGLDALIDALSQLPASSRPRVRMAGIDFQGGMTATTELVNKANLSDWVSVGPAVHGEAKSDFLARCIAYVHPSRWESHSIALVEALAMGVPSVVSAQIHIAEELRRSQAAVCTDLDPVSLGASLDAAATHQSSLSEGATLFVRQRLSQEAAVSAWDAYLRGPSRFSRAESERARLSRG